MNITNEFNDLQWPFQSQELNPLGIHRSLGCGRMGDSLLCVQLANLQKLHDAIMSTWNGISKECFQHLGESMPQSIEAVMIAKGGRTEYSIV